MPKDNNRRSRNRSGSNRSNSSSNRDEWGVMEMTRERPFTAAAVAAAAVGAGVFLWSRRNQISDQISNLSDQIGEWTENMNFGGGDSGWSGDDTAGLTTTGTTPTGTTGTTGSTSRRSGSSTTGTRGRSSTTGRSSGMSETGGGNASLGNRSGGGGIPTT